MIAELEQGLTELSLRYGISDLTLKQGHTAILFKDNVEIQIFVQEQFASFYSPIVRIPDEQQDFVLERLEDNLLGFDEPHLCWSKLKKRPDLFIRKDVELEDLEQAGLEALISGFHIQVQKQQQLMEELLTTSPTTQAQQISPNILHA